MEDILKQISVSYKEDINWLKAQVDEDLNSDEWKNRKDEYIETILKQAKIGWRHRIFDDLIKLQKEYDEYLTNPVEVEEGVLQCRKCKSERVLSQSLQVRSGDEATSTFARCSVCNYKWVQN